MRDYMPEAAALDHDTFPAPETVASWLGPNARVEVLPIPADTPDRMLGAFWAHPEWVLDESMRASTSGFARQGESIVNRVVSAVEADLASGAWDERYGHLRDTPEFDAGLRLIIDEPSPH